MVSRILFIVTLLFSSFAMSQDENGLTFSEVLLVELTEEGVVVPEGKVWKVVSSIYNLPNNLDEDYIYHFLINNKEVMVFTNHFYKTITPCNVFPLWLPTGTNLSSGYMVSALSIIEFNTN